MCHRFREVPLLTRVSSEVFFHTLLKRHLTKT